MKMDEHARAWSHEFVSDVLSQAPIAPEQRSSLYWEIMSHLHEAAERRAADSRADRVRMADIQAVVDDLGGRAGVSSTFLQTRVAATPRAGFGRRLAAFLVDAVLIGVGFGLVLGALDMALNLIPFPYGNSPWNAFDDWLGLFFLPTVFAYFASFEYWTGSTPGKTVFRLRTVRSDGGPLTWREATIRNVAKAIPPLLLLDAILYLVAFRQEDRRASDRLAETMVIDTNQAPRGWSPVGGGSPTRTPDAPPTPERGPARLQFLRDEDR